MALVTFGARDPTRHVRLVMGTRSCEVLRECAYVDMEHLEKDGRLAVEGSPQVTSINYKGINRPVNPELPVLLQLLLAEEYLALHGGQDNVFARASDWHRQRNRVITSVEDTTAILIGTGPSLSSINLSKYQKCLTIACNKIHLLPYEFEPSHIVFEDRVVTEDVFSQRTTFGRSRVWLPPDLSYLLPGKAIVYPLDRHVHGFPRFSVHPTIAYSGWTVMFIMLQVAFWMRIRRAYLVGVDGYTGRPQSVYNRGVLTSTEEDDQHFHPLYYGPGQRFQPHQPERVLAAYRLADQVYRDAGCAIINCSVGSRVDAFVKGALPPPEVLA